VVYLDRQAGQWVGVIEMDTILNAGKQSPQMLLSSSLEAQ